MPAYEVPVRFTVNDRQFQKALTDSRKELNRLGKEYDEIVEAQKRKTKQDDKLVRGNKQLSNTWLRKKRYVSISESLRRLSAQVYQQASKPHSMTL